MPNDFPSVPQPAAPVVDSDPESDPDADFDRLEGCIPADRDKFQDMGDLTKEPTEAECDAASELREKAAAAFAEQKFDEAVTLYTEAILLNPTNAMYYAKRGQAFLKLLKPNACIRDCERALDLNGDSAFAYKYHGRASRLLGDWETAAQSLRQACKIDFDEEADEWLREVTPNALRLEQHQIKQDRRLAKRTLRHRQEQARKSQEAHKRFTEEQKARQTAASGGDDTAGGMGGAEDLLSALNDPEVAAAFQDIMSNPGNISKYLGNPKIMKLVSKIGAGRGGFPGMGGGGFPGAAGAGFPGGAFPDFAAPPGSGGGAANAAPPKPPTDLHDDGLD